MHIPSALAVVAVFCQAVAADWTIAIRDDNTRTDRQIWGSGGGCQRFGQAIGYRCSEVDYRTGQDTGGCRTSNWRGQNVIGINANSQNYCWIYARGDCTGDDNNRVRIDRGQQNVRLPSGGNINSFSCSG
ncbi:hypothetical protein QBC37DRAFT_374751 [Rhypophila decipiens]|uniref:Uncharacterized protein n=1 Tax=Rhypophila decipiens TaxID=261697 RepID=A0AAN6Y7E5_9PEZI|nr:hypothetical protein QBC37DRAFT_374751 [Rhypophila decipiens]